VKTKVACSMHAGIFHQTATQFRCLWWGGGSWRGAYAASARSFTAFGFFFEFSSLLTDR
jgi:hypothetical protein